MVGLTPPCDKIIVGMYVFEVDCLCPSEALSILILEAELMMLDRAASNLQEISQGTLYQSLKEYVYVAEKMWLCEILFLGVRTRLCSSYCLS